MGSSKIRRALGAVKDSTSIGLAKVGNSSALSDLDVAIVKATRHDEYPAEERHIREILSLTCYSRAYISACVATLSRRLGKTKSWTVALKTLVLIHRLLSEGDPAYEQEIFFATRQGTRMLNMSDFRDTSRSDAWDYSAFVRTFALYLDERLDFRMHGRRARRRSRSVCDEDEAQAQAQAAAAINSSVTPVREMKTDRLFMRTQHLQQLLDRFLACRPTGSAKNNRIVAVALYPLVKESYQLYFDLQELMSIFIDRFMELEVPECVRIYDIFCRLAKQFEELDHFYSWCKTAGVSRPSEFPDVERITAKKLEVMDDFIRDKSALSRSKEETTNPEDDEASVADYDVNAVRALPAPETTSEEEAAPALADQQEEEIKQSEESNPGPADKPEDVDFLNLRADPVISGQEHGDQLALALFDGAAAQPAGAPAWEAFKEDTADWEKGLVVSASSLSGQKASLGGGFDTSLLDGMYSQAWHATSQGFLDSGSASSVALPVPSAQPMLALPAPPVRPGGNNNNNAGMAAEDPFAASLAVPPPSYVQMSEMEKKKQLLLEEQRMWQQYARDGMQGQLGMGRMQQNGRYPMGGYPGPMF